MEEGAKALADRREDFGKQVWPHLDSLYRVARRFADPAAAEDLVQETVLKAWKNLHLFRAGTNFKAWVFRILVNSAINATVADSRRPTSQDLDPETPPDQEVRYVRTEDLDRMGDSAGDEAMRALERLSTDLRQVFVLSTFEGMTYREISETLGIPVGTVMSRLFRARGFLRGELADPARERRLSR